jgi:hypothetical protein
MILQGNISYPHPVMAGLDPAIQSIRAIAVWRLVWMAASRAAMTGGGSFARASAPEAVE